MEINEEKKEEELSVKDIKVGAIYRHFKGNYYIVKDIAYDSETCEPLVIYQALYRKDREFKIWSRSAKIFTQIVDKIWVGDNNKGPEYKYFPRFAVVEEEYGEMISNCIFSFSDEYYSEEYYQKCVKVCLFFVAHCKKEGFVKFIHEFLWKNKENYIHPFITKEQKEEAEKYARL